MLARETDHDEAAIATYVASGKKLLACNDSEGPLALRTDSIDSFWFCLISATEH